MKLLVDMNLAPAWVAQLEARGRTAIHWSSVGDPRADDRELVAVARAEGWTILTSDLDFAAILALAGAAGPSVILLRTQDLLAEALCDLVCAVLAEHADAIEAGAIVTIDKAAARVRILPVRRPV